MSSLFDSPADRDFCIAYREHYNFSKAAAYRHLTLNWEGKIADHGIRKLHEGWLMAHESFTKQGTTK